MRVLVTVGYCGVGEGEGGAAGNTDYGSYAGTGDLMTGGT